MITRAVGIVCSATLLATGSVTAQGAHPLIGKWSIEFQRGQRMENGTVTPIMGSGELVIVARNDSLIATLTTGPRPDGTLAPPATLQGTVTSTGAVLVQKSTAQVTVNGEVQSIEATTTWTLAVRGEAMEGTLVREVPGLMVQLPVEPSPVKGRRIP